MTLKDDLGRAVTLATPARRIASLTPVTTENLFAIGAGALIVGGTRADDFPAAAKRLPRLGDFGKPSYEKLLFLRPDLIVLDSATIALGDAETLARRARCPVFVQKSARAMDIARHLRQLGALAGRVAEAEKQARLLEKALARFSKAAEGRKSVKVFIEVSPVPLYGAGPGSLPDDALRLLGATNALTSGGPYPVVSKEALLAADPDLYVIATAGVSPAPRRFAPPLDRLRAVREKRVIPIPADHLFRATPRLVQGLRALRGAIDSQSAL